MKEDFKVFIEKKGINGEAFQRSMPKLYLDFERELIVGGAVAMELRKKFFWNDLRIMFPIQRPRVETPMEFGRQVTT